MKGSTNVTSFIVKTLQHLNVLRDNSVGGELNIIFDNCGGQNKNSTVLRLAAWLMAVLSQRTVLRRGRFASFPVEGKQ